VQDYKGKIELIVRAGVARSVSAECVYEHDLFEMELGSHPFIRHRPSRDVAERGKMLGAYAVADLGQRHQPVIKYMPVGRDRRRFARSALEAVEDGALKPWYARKTVVHQLAKVLPKNARLAEVLRAFDEDGDSRRWGRRRRPAVRCRTRRAGRGHSSRAATATPARR
jgi:recombinational DNA repair protein RecT